MAFRLGSGPKPKSSSTVKVRRTMSEIAIATHKTTKRICSRCFRMKKRWLGLRRTEMYTRRRLGEMLTLATHALRPTAVTTCSSSSAKSKKRSLRWLNSELCPQASHPSNFSNNCCKCSQHSTPTTLAVKKVNRPYPPQDSHRRIINLTKASSSE